MSELLDLMEPEGLDPAQQAAYKAATGQNQLPVEEFKGTWRVAMEDRVENVEKRKEQGKKDFHVKAERGLKDVVLTMMVPDKEEFSKLVITLRKRFGYDNTAELVLDALRYFNEHAVLEQ